MHNALLVIDMLNDFVLPGAPLEVPNTRKIIGAIQTQLEKAREAGDSVIYICDSHAPDDPEFSRMNWPAHAVRGTDGARVIDELAPGDTEEVIAKTSYSAFLKTNLQELLQKRGIDHLTLTGCVTNICVLYSAYDAVTRGYDVTVLSECVADLDAADGAFALKQMQEVLGVRVV